MTQAFVEHFKSSIRQDDMLIKWSETKFLITYLVDDGQKAQQVLVKLKSILENYKLPGFTYELRSSFQKNNEKINKLINTLLDK